MRAILLVSHGDYSHELKRSLEMIAGPAANVFTVGLQPSQGPEDLQAAFAALEPDLHDYSDLLVFSDLYGGSPGKEAFLHFYGDERAQFIAGMNFPMVLTAMLEPDLSFAELLETGRTGIVDLRAALAQFSDDDE